MNCVSSSRWHICRICLRNDSKELHKIFDNEQDGKIQVLENLRAKIEINGGIKLSDDKNLPNKICNRCLLLLRASCKFRDLCEFSQWQLQPFLRRTGQIETRLQPDKSVTDTDLEKHGDCMFLDHKDNDIENNKQATLPEQYVYSIKESDDDDFLPVSPDVDQIVDGDTMEYIYEPPNESSQDTQDQITIENDACNPYSIEDDNLLHIQYFEVAEGVGRATLPIKDAEASDLHDEMIEDPLKRKRPSLKIGQRTKEDDTIFRCHYCDNIYHDKAKYAVHIKMHKKVKPHECEICGKRFSTTPQLSRHMNSHTGQRPYKCKYCEACFGDPSTRIKHERIHTNERPYKCVLCPKSFAYSNVLKVHMMVHTGEKPYVCAYCGKAFSQIHHKNSHEKRHRKVHNLDPIMNDADLEEEFRQFEDEQI